MNSTMQNELLKAAFARKKTADNSGETRVEPEEKKSTTTPHPSSIVNKTQELKSGEPLVEPEEKKSTSHPSSIVNKGMPHNFLAELKSRKPNPGNRMSAALIQKFRGTKKAIPELSVETLTLNRDNAAAAIKLFPNDGDNADKWTDTIDNDNTLLTDVIQKMIAHHEAIIKECNKSKKKSKDSIFNDVEIPDTYSGLNKLANDQAKLSMCSNVGLANVFHVYRLKEVLGQGYGNVDGDGGNGKQREYDQFKIKVAYKEIFLGKSLKDCKLEISRIAKEEDEDKTKKKEYSPITSEFLSNALSDHPDLIREDKEARNKELQKWISDTNDSDILTLAKQSRKEILSHFKTTDLKIDALTGSESAEYNQVKDKINTYQKAVDEARRKKQNLKVASKKLEVEQKRLCDLERRDAESIANKVKNIIQTIRSKCKPGPRIVTTDQEAESLKTFKNMSEQIAHLTLDLDKMFGFITSSLNPFDRLPDHDTASLQELYAYAPAVKFTLTILQFNWNDPVIKNDTLLKKYEKIATKDADQYSNIPKLKQDLADWEKKFWTKISQKKALEKNLERCETALQKATVKGIDSQPTINAYKKSVEAQVDVVAVETEAQLELAKKESDRAAKQVEQQTVALEVAKAVVQDCKADLKEAVKNQEKTESVVPQLEAQLDTVSEVKQMFHPGKGAFKSSPKLTKRRGPYRRAANLVNAADELASRLRQTRKTRQIKLIRKKSENKRTRRNTK